jgi:hypothetical protein
MKSLVRYAALVLYALAATPGTPADGLHLTTSLDVMAGQWLSASGSSLDLSLYAVPTVAVTIGKPQFQVGGEVKLPVGLRGDAYLAAMLLLRFGPCDSGAPNDLMSLLFSLLSMLGSTELGAGVSTRLAGTVDPSMTYPQPPQCFACRLGWIFPIWTVGPGKLGLNVSLDWLITELKTTELGFPEARDGGSVPFGGGAIVFLVELLIAAPLYALAYVGEAVRAGGKLSIGVTYALDF